MPKVTRQRPITHDERLLPYYRQVGVITDVITEKVNLKWSEITKSEKATAVVKRVLGAAVLASLLYIQNPNGRVDSWGDLPHNVKKAEQISTANARAEQLYSAQTTAGKYSLLFLHPAKTTIGGDVGGKGFLGWIGSGNSELSVRIGQDCLAGSAYDITPSQIGGRAYGDVSAPAALQPTDTGVRIYPAGSNAPALDFAISANGMLQPDIAASKTIAAYGCSDGLATYEEVGFEKYQELPRT